MVSKNDIKEHASVIASCGSHVGTVDHMEGEDSIKLTRSDAEANGQHHVIPLSWVEKVEGNNVILNKDKSEVQQGWKAV
ncbi:MULTISPECIES: DUF2171 domain-containing protein [Tenebrionibacter/Tenebrionicola group]|jgi:hypothetical protein|uniref:DUF2171 domain-containing protein n=2 Tax=Tenebrionibacter/Tenebrionicola group TaxID=2969848 RepID=A0A8K0V6D8_9ENTR|nr:MULTISPECIES: DUF2171 domain-containing protein [Tenebrionibacter/Tenebrionicola group]MBK4716248.1 DUF2171 domain-containing protein [Tenebrionibacter intestinalis]MBV4411286.1 DUF2171 domain-containing protein [Tenebrionicola larvae]MBV5096903.1 DUF2171 domain-containing protein [Tenebrionicola larvae]